jgi:SAM-dependent methyltransferase
MAWDDMRASYDRVAGRYEARFLDELAGKPRDRELLDAFAASVGDPVVEVGCGPGQIGHYVRARGHHVVGADISFAMAERAVARIDAAVVADMRRLPLSAGAIGGLLAFYSLIHVRRSELDHVLREYARVLQRDGRLLLSAHEGRGEHEVDEFLGERVPFAATFFQLDELVAAVSTAGFEIVIAERRAPYANESETFRLYIAAKRVRQGVAVRS